MPRGVCRLYCLPGMAEDFGAGRANPVKARARVAATFRSALTGFAPALGCHYPGQAGALQTDSKAFSLQWAPQLGSLWQLRQPDCSHRYYSKWATLIQ
jgi:hypothetical protein